VYLTTALLVSDKRHLNVDSLTPCEYLEDKVDYQRRIKRAAIPRARDSLGTFAESGRHPPRALEVLTLFRGPPALPSPPPPDYK
jgi:hypothetical protein